MENSCRKKYKQSSKNWVLASRRTGFRRNSAVIPANAGLFHYAGNCPVRYIDPDGREEVYFIYTYTSRKKDWFMKNIGEGGKSAFSDEISLCKNELWLSVKYVPCGTKDSLVAAFSDPEARLIVISGHGYKEAAIATYDDKKFTPSDIDDISNNLSTVIFENCHQGDYKSDWAAKLGDVDIVTWNGITTTTETKNFNSDGGKCRQKFNLKHYLLKVFYEKWIKDVNSSDKE